MISFNVISCYVTFHCKWLSNIQKHSQITSLFAWLGFTVKQQSIGHTAPMIHLKVQIRLKTKYSIKQTNNNNKQTKKQKQQQQKINKNKTQHVVINVTRWPLLVVFHDMRVSSFPCHHGEEHEKVLQSPYSNPGNKGLQSHSTGK